MSLYIARSLADIAAQFRKMAETSDRVASSAITRTARIQGEVAARVWRDAAAVLDQTTIQAPEDKRTEADKDYDMDRYSQR